MELGGHESRRLVQGTLVYIIQNFGDSKCNFVFWCRAMSLRLSGGFERDSADAILVSNAPIENSVPGHQSPVYKLLK